MSDQTNDEHGDEATKMTRDGLFRLEHMATVVASTQNMKLLHEADDWDSAPQEDKENIVALIQAVSSRAVIEASPYLRAAALRDFAADHPELRDILLDTACRIVNEVPVTSEESA